MNSQIIKLFLSETFVDCLSIHRKELRGQTGCSTLRTNFLKNSFSYNGTMPEQLTRKLRSG